MTNYEKYKNEIDKFTCLGISFGFNIKTKKFDACYNIADCENCMFHNVKSCLDNKIKWAYAECIEQEIDWSKVAVNTPILVSNNNVNWFRRHFAKYDEVLVYAWNDGNTSYTTDSTTYWKYAKLSGGKLTDTEDKL